VTSKQLKFQIPNGHGLGVNHSELKTTYTQLKCITPLSPSQVLVCHTVLGEIIQVVLELELGHPKPSLFLLLSTRSIYTRYRCTLDSAHPDFMLMLSMIHDCSTARGDAELLPSLGTNDNARCALSTAGLSQLYRSNRPRLL